MSRQRTKSRRRTKAQSLIPSVLPAAPKGTDSKPGSFILPGDLDSGARDKWLSNMPVLNWLDVKTAQTCMDETIRGAYARTQWTYELMEQSDALLSAGVRRRRAALGKIPWLTELVDDVPDEYSNEADRQLATLSDFYNGLKNFKKSILELGSSEFRGYKILQKVITDRGDLELQATDNWNWVRDGYRGAWGWNPDASFGLTYGQAVPVARDNLIIRTSSLPIDHVAIFNVLSRANTLAQWHAYNGTYGVPVIMLYMPEGISEQDRQKFIDIASRITSNGRGVLPAGSKVDMLAPAASATDSLFKLMTHEEQELVMVIMGGQMTMLTAPGAGTTEATGSTHQNSFDDLADWDGEEIADVLNDDLTTDVLDEYHPGEPHLARLAIRRPDEESGKQVMQDIATLFAAGLSMKPEKVKELTGYEVERILTSNQIYPTKSVGFRPTEQALEESLDMPIEPLPLALMDNSDPQTADAKLNSEQAVNLNRDDKPAVQETDPETARIMTVLDKVLKPATPEKITKAVDLIAPHLEESAKTAAEPENAPEATSDPKND